MKTEFLSLSNGNRGCSCPRNSVSEVKKSDPNPVLPFYLHCILQEKQIIYLFHNTTRPVVSMVLQVTRTKLLHTNERFSPQMQISPVARYSDDYFITENSVSLPSSFSTFTEEHSVLAKCLNQTSVICLTVFSL